MNIKFNDFLYESDLEGKRVRLIKMVDDPNPIEPGTEGTIKYVDGMKQLIVDWDNGRSLSLLPGIDEYIILNEELDAVTVGLVGNGTAVTGYPTGSWATSAGQAVYGGDSGSAFATNSTANNFKADSTTPEILFAKEPGKKRTKKNKKERLNNQLGTEVDQLYKPTIKAKNENMKTFNEFTRLNEDDGGGASAGGDGGGAGSSVGTLGSIGGMGAIVSAQPSSIPGDVAGSTKGSGDIGRPLGVYGKQPAGIFKKKNKKSKRGRPYDQIGAGIDNFYVSKYAQGDPTSGGKLIQNWKTFTDTKN